MAPSRALQRSARDPSMCRRLGGGALLGDNRAVPCCLVRGAIPDVLAPDLKVVFCGINAGRVSAAAAAHYANPRNDFWRLLNDAGFTARLYDPSEQFALLELGIGVTNAAYRTTPGSGELRRGDFDAGRL